MQNDNNFNMQGNYINNHSNQIYGTTSNVQEVNVNQMSNNIYSNNNLNINNNQNNIKNKHKGNKKLILIILSVILVVSIVFVILFVISNSNANKVHDIDNNNNVNNNTDNNKKLTIDDVMNAPESSVDDFLYDVTDEGVEISDYHGKGGIVVVPEKIDGIDVVLIGMKAFTNESKVTAVKLPDTVKEIGAHAFENCYNMEIFIAGKSLKTLKEYSFNGTTKLRKVLLNEGLERIERLACIGCWGSSLLEIEIPSTVTYIGYGGLYVIDSDGGEPMTVIGIPGSYIEEYIKEYGEELNLVFQAK